MKILMCIISSQRYFEQPLSIRGKSIITDLFKRNAKTVQKIFKYIPGFDFNYEEFTEVCKEA